MNTEPHLRAPTESVGRCHGGRARLCVTRYGHQAWVALCPPRPFLAAAGPSSPRRALSVGARPATLASLRPPCGSPRLLRGFSRPFGAGDFSDNAAGLDRSCAPLCELAALRTRPAWDSAASRSARWAPAHLLPSSQRPSPRRRRHHRFLGHLCWDLQSHLSSFPSSQPLRHVRRRIPVPLPVPWLLPPRVRCPTPVTEIIRRLSQLVFLPTPSISHIIVRIVALKYCFRRLNFLWFRTPDSLREQIKTLVIRGSSPSLPVCVTSIFFPTLLLKTHGRLDEAARCGLRTPGAHLAEVSGRGPAAGTGAPSSPPPWKGIRHSGPAVRMLQRPRPCRCLLPGDVPGASAVIRRVPPPRGHVLLASTLRMFCFHY